MRVVRAVCQESQQSRMLVESGEPMSGESGEPYVSRVRRAICQESQENRISVESGVSHVSRVRRAVCQESQ